MEVSVAEFIDELVPCKSRDVFDGGIGLAELLDIDIQVPVVEQLDKFVVYRPLKIAYVKIVSRRRHFYRNLDDMGLLVEATVIRIVYLVDLDLT